VSDVIEKLLEVERQARQIIAEAEQQAAQVLGKAQEDARQVGADGRRDAQHEAADLLKRQAEEMERQRQQRLEQEKARLPAADSMDRQKLAEGIDFVVQAVAYGKLAAEQ
jgi:vacuolar-type H+-ATPase subunit H